MTGELLDHYQQAVDQQKLVFDDCQWQALQALQSTYDELIQRHTSWWQRLWSNDTVKGVYMYGPVGSGKTYLLDLFYEHLPLDNKKREHFHRFMAWIHDQIARLKEAGDPLQQIAKDYAEQCCLLCFDEFYVTNIADAMVLGELLQALSDQGVTLIMSSNIEPQRLYEGGLNRERFLPTIDWIEQQHQVIPVDNGRDYRYQQSVSKQGSRYYYPISDDYRQTLWQTFEQIASGSIEYAAQLTINGRPIDCLAYSDDSIVFDFRTLCQVPRSQRDYLQLAQQYQHWFVLDIPILGRRQHTLICNFIKLIDILYDNGNDIWVLADAPIAQLYPKGKHRFAFKRTQSRLQAMQRK